MARGPLRPALKEVIYHIRTVDRMVPIRGCGFNVSDGALVVTGKDRRILRVFAQGHWQEITVEEIK